ncbi:conserved hypothetical protein [Streptomyces scabiei 87.22]|uniref:Uncharacterized protein n=1 Tax=Streptomyces scabiei (strain 87.22) TaxID=680198 RepID=C9ZC47_STRSW|nr:hypothetical protein [Streptomyces scabiei]MDX2574897.1 hypothetical protein [Streptomyces scabiei]MDX2650817.1 hypothetical protein [Streptomyces scabiei]MDX2719841.1 hypothetical protein [Streptomyces scabiei]MDX2868851.1 hypothetical protein [Streptomyces scabiei]MDX2886025.1 hypothetical protein [Streptomyces scabiei]
MTDTGKPTRRPRQLHELTDLYDFLDEVRLRPGMWVRGRSLLHLESILIGYTAALGVHGIDEDCDLQPRSLGPFAQWLWRRLGMTYPSSLGWAVEIERKAEQTDVPAMELFFELLDEFRAAGHEAHQVQPAGQASAEGGQSQQSVSDPS